MDAVDEIPVLILHILETDVTENTGIVKQNINTTEVLDSSLNDTLAILYTVVVGNRLTASGTDLLNDDIGSLEMNG